MICEFFVSVNAVPVTVTVVARLRCGEALMAFPEHEGEAQKHQQQSGGNLTPFSEFA